MEYLELLKGFNCDQIGYREGCMSRMILFKNADLYDPNPVGVTNVFFCGDCITHIGEINEKKLLESKLDIEVLDLKKNILTPGIIDPHSHILGGSGENGGFSSQSPEISLTELVKCGITTVVGTLGADTTMKTMEGLLAKVKGLNDEGLRAYCYTGGYTVPPTSIMSSCANDIIFIDEIIATGELAISDERADEPTSKDLAKVVVDTHVAGMLADKAGVTHFHVGEGKRRLQCLYDLLEYAPEIHPEWLYPTHINRNEKLIEKAIPLARKKSFLDMDVTTGNLAKWLRAYTKFGGKFEQLTISSDAGLTSPKNLYNEVKDCVLQHRFKLEKILPLCTKNPAKALKLKNKGEIKLGFEPSFIVLEKSTLEIIHVVSNGKFMVRDGQLVVREKFLENSNRAVHLIGDQA